MKPRTMTPNLTRNLALMLVLAFAGTSASLAQVHKSNTSTGINAAKKLDSGKNNTADGFKALLKNDDGSFNTAVGSGALKKNTGSSNVAMGFQALFKNKDGQFNVAIGDGAMLTNVSGNNNVALGMDAGALTNGSDNILIDHKGVAGESGNIRIGTPGTHKNTYIAGKIWGDGSGLTGITGPPGPRGATGATGPQGIPGPTGTNLTLGGITTGNFNLPASTSAASGVILQGGSPLIHTFGSGNFFAGQSAGNFSMTGNHNTATGRFALSSNTTGDNNTATGYESLSLNTTGHENTATGMRSLSLNTTGNYNTANGNGALYANKTGGANTAVGEGALFQNVAGSNNTGIGVDALGSSTGSGNAALGEGSLGFNNAGNNNTAIGYYADVTSGALTNATAIGYNAKVNASNKIRLGNTSVTVIEGQVPFSFTSDRTKKENFLPVNGAEVLGKLRDIEFTSWNYIGQDALTQRHYGVMAQDFHAAFGQDALGTIGTPITVNGGDMAGIMMTAIKELATENAALKSQLSAFEARLALLEQAAPAGAATVQVSLKK